MNDWLPKTILGKWSVGLNALFLTTVTVSVVLVQFFKVLDFGNRWWDVTVAIIFPTSIVALTAGMVAKLKRNDRSLLVLLSIILGFGVVAFILFHSLFIHD